MKRYGNLYKKIYEMENIREAHKNARRGKTHYREVKQVDKDPERYFKRIYHMLKNKSFHNSRYTVYTKHDGNKDRLIYRLPYFPDRIIHHCIMQIVGPIWTKTLISDTYACITGRGIHKGVKRIKQAIRSVPEGTKYCLKCDVRKFYPSVDHEVLKTIIRKKIKDKDLLWLLDEIIDSAPGIPIGNYLSQHFGNLYLSGLDHEMKEAKNCKYYFRYCDDIVILDSNKSRLHNLRVEIQQSLSGLNLTLKSDYKVFPIDQGVDFLGYRFFKNYTLVRKSIVARFKCKVLSIHNGVVKTDAILSTVMSYNGWLKWADTFNLKKALFDYRLKNILWMVSAYMKVHNPVFKLGV